MKKTKYFIALIAFIGFLTLYNYVPMSSSLKIHEQAPPICINSRCEPQVKPNCKNSMIRIWPCQQISENLWKWINSYGRAALKSGYRAAGYTDRIKSATIFCNVGIYSRKRISRRTKRWSQHSFRRACDGNKIKINGITFRYHGRGLQRPRTKHDRFFIAFLNKWGTTGLGVNVKSTFYFLDYNRGVRDCREDNRHCHHFHLSKPCYACIFTGTMGYE